MIKPRAFCSFQFHKGTIKTLHNNTKKQNRLNFNSIKVRLKQACQQVNNITSLISIP